MVALRAVVRSITLLGSMSLLGSCFCHGPSRTRTAALATPPSDVPLAAPAMDSAPTSIEMRNVNFHLGGDVVMRIRHLQGLIRGRDGVVDFDDSRSFTTYVSSAEVGLGGDDLSNLMNNHVFAYRGAPLRNIRVELKGGKLVQSGILHKGVDIPFKIVADVSLTTDGRIRLHPVDTDIFCVDGDKLMKALGLTMQKMVDVSKAVGVSIEKNDFILDPIRVLPPPVIKGRLLSVRVVNDELVQEIGPLPGTEAQFASAPTPPDTSARNYMYYRGGRLHFGRKLLMQDADMQVVDAEPSDPFDFDLDHYMVQLVAGYSRTLANAGLWVVMPDAHRVTRLEQTVGGEVSSVRDTTCNCAKPPPVPRPPSQSGRSKKP
jgi:hypothetical protein